MRWNGVQAISFSEANAARTDSVRESDAADQLTAIDIGLWVRWVSAISEGNQSLADFLRERFRPELKTANDAWLAAEPLKNANEPSSPFVMDAYSLATRQEAQRLAKLADQKTQEAKDANQRSDNYVLLTVIFASVLLIVGVGGKFETPGLRVFSTVVGWVILLAVWGVLSTLPVH